MMLEHLLSPEFDDPADADTSALLSAQANTVSFLESLGSPEHMIEENDRARARSAFAATTSPTTTPAEANKAILKLKVPEAVRHLSAMLTQYDWDFIEQAKQLRGYVVAGLLEETKHKDARIRLKALELTGKLTEVASFTERTEITIKNEDTSVLESRLRDRIKSLLPPVQVVQDTEIKEIAVVKHAPSALSA